MDTCIMDTCIMDTCIMDTSAWVTRPERPKGAKSSRPEGPQARSRGPLGPWTSSEIQYTTHLCSGTYEDDGGDGEDDGDVDANGGDESNLLLLRESLGAAGSTVAKTNCVRMLRHLSTTVNRYPGSSDDNDGVRFCWFQIVVADFF